MVSALLLSGLILSQSVPAVDRPPASLMQLRDAALAIYGPALHGDWSAASGRLSDIDPAMTEATHGTTKPDLVRQLRGRLVALRRAVHDRRAIAAATDANWVSRLCDEIAATYDTALPLDVRLLGFFGRALQIDASRPRRQHAKTDLADLRTVWRSVEPWVLQRNGVPAARQFNDTLVNLDGAVSRGDLASAATAEVAAANQVAAVYRGGAGQAP